jgi:hypothetical protein
MTIRKGQKMDIFESQKMRLQELVKNHHSAEAHQKDMDEMLKEHPEASNLGVCHESFSDKEHDESKMSMKKWGIPK